MLPDTHRIYRTSIGFERQASQALHLVFHAKRLLGARFAMIRFDLVVTLSDKRTKYSTSNVPSTTLSVIRYVISPIEYLLQLINSLSLARSWRSLDSLVGSGIDRCDRMRKERADYKFFTCPYPVSRRLSLP